MLTMPEGEIDALRERARADASERHGFRGEFVVYADDTPAPVQEGVAVGALTGCV